MELPDGCEDKQYLETLGYYVERVLSEVNPGIAFFQSGVDVLATDKLGRLSLSMEGCRLRDRMVFSRCALNNIPVVAVMGGGYSTSLQAIVKAHANTFEEARRAFD